MGVERKERGMETMHGGEGGADKRGAERRCEHEEVSSLLPFFPHPPPPHPPPRQFKLALAADYEFYQRIFHSGARAANEGHMYQRADELTGRLCAFR